MASPPPDQLAVTPATVRRPSLTPGFRVLGVSTPPTIDRTPLFNEAIWKRLRDAGFDAESIKRRDKAALIAYIANLEAEIYDLQHNMGLLLVERKDWVSKYEQAKLSVESAEIAHKHDQAALSSALAEARKREDNLKKALGIEKECLASIEKTLHEMRAECAEVKVTAENKLAEARSLFEDTHKKYSEAEKKQHLGESLQADATRYRQVAERKLQEVEAREDDLRGRIASFKSDCDAKEKELVQERQSLSERQKTVNQAEDRLLDGQALLNQREADVLNKYQELKRLEKEILALQEKNDEERKGLMVERSKLEVVMASFSEREKAVIEKEALLNKKDQQLLLSQEKLANKQHYNVRRLMAEQENALKTRMTEFETELEMKRKLVEEEIEAKQRSWELSELDLKQREDFVLEKEQELVVQLRAMTDKDKDMMERLSLIEKRENVLNKAEKEVESKKLLLQKEKEEIDLVKLDLQTSLHSVDVKKKEIIDAETNLETMKSETRELIVLETKLKEEIDLVRTQKLELEVEADKLKIEKEKFETEWELIDVKRGELKREEEHIVAEKLAIAKFLQDERDSLNLERAAMRDQYKQDLECLCHDREAFLSEVQHERSECFSKIQQERSDFLLDIEMRKRELEDCVNQRREEIESYLREKEKAFEEEKKKELQYISSLREEVMKERDHATLEMKRLEAERLQVNLDHERRDKEWAELTSLIEELEMQRQKLEKQRELLHADREEIHSEIEHLEKLENLKIPSDKIVIPEIQQHCPDFSNLELSIERFSKCQTIGQVHKLHSECKNNFDKDGGALNVYSHCSLESCSHPSSTNTFSWFRRWIFKQCPDGLSSENGKRPLRSEYEDERLRLVEKEYTEKDARIRSDEGLDPVRNGNDPANASTEVSGRTASEEPKVIHEVPPVGEHVKIVCGLETKSQMGVRENFMHTSPRTPSQKRRIEKLPALAGDRDTSLDEQEPSKKKRKQVDDTLNPSGDVAPNGLELKQPDILVDQHAVISSNQSEGCMENPETSPVEVIGSSVLTPQVIDIDECNRIHPNLVQSFEVELNKDVLQYGGLDGQDGSAQVEHGTLTSVIEEQTIIEEVLLVDGKEATMHTKSQGPAANETKELEHSDPADSTSDKDFSEGTKT
ncbi:hypothetical protein Nepgr_027115 [Nepenthes gracilis]|uniref:Nuclear matrix constituent protein 1-like protein n=1 Tax=Nepenthes gracilis TaxID=150966 RepID=A0AAD3Y0Z2_NEPGR|nr:hypothetical protein Nepgr_027115 [Nepenthes gracilis]